MSLADLETQIRKNIAEHEGILNLAGIQETSIQHILQNISAALALGNPDIIGEDRSLKITGTIDLPNISSIFIDLSFELGDEEDIETCSLNFMTGSGNEGDLALELGGQILAALKSDASTPSIIFSEVRFSCKPKTKELSLKVKSPDSWSPFGESLDITIQDVDIEIRRSEEVSGATLKDMKFSGHLLGTLIVGDASIAISASFPDLILNLDIKSLDFATLFSDIGLTDVSDFLSSFTPVETPSFDFHLDYTATTKAFSLDFSTSGEWKILESPDVFIRPSIHVQRDIPPPGKDPVVNVNLSGIVRIGKMVVTISTSFPNPVFSIDFEDFEFSVLASDLGLTELSDALSAISLDSEHSTFDVHFEFISMTKEFLFRMLPSSSWIVIEQPLVTFNPVISISRDPIKDSKIPPVAILLQGVFKMGMITAEVAAEFPKPTITVDIQDVGLTSLISSLGFPEISNFLNSIIPLAIPLFDVKFEYLPSTKAYEMNITTDGEWRLKEGFEVLLNPIITVSGIKEKTEPKATLHGYTRIGSTIMDYEVVLTHPNPVFKANTILDFQAIVGDLGIAPLHELKDSFSLPPDQKVELTVWYVLKTKEFAVHIEPTAAITVPYFNFSIDGVKITITQKLDELNQREYTVYMQGTFNIGELPVTVWCKFPGDFEIRASVPISVNLGTFTESCLQIFNIPVPAGLAELGILELTKLELRVVPKIPLFSAIVATKSGEIEIVIKKDSEGNWMKILALPLGINNSLGMLNVPQLPELVSTAISNPALLLSTAKLKRPVDQSQQPLQTVKLVTDLIPGINFQATFKDDMITDLLNVDSLSIAGYIGLKPFSLQFLARSTLEVDLWDVFFLKGFDFWIRYATSEFEIGIGSDMDLRIGDESVPLRNTISLELDPAPSLMFSAYMTKAWIDPFDLKGITLNDLAVGFGITKPFLPEFNFKAGVTIESVTGAAMVSLKGPALQLLSIEFKKLNIGTVVRALLTCVAEFISDPFFTFLDGIVIEDVKFHYALSDTTIGGIDYGIGFHMKAILDFLGFKIEADAMLDLDDGMRIYAAMDPVNISLNGFELIKFTHVSDTSKGAMLDLDLRKSSNNLQMMVSGAISILGGLMKGLVDIDVDGDGFNFLANCKIFDSFEASLEVTGPSLKNLLDGSGNGVHLIAYMRHDLLTYIRDRILNFIHDVTESAVAELTSAQNTLDAAQLDVDNWDKQITEMITLVQEEQDAVIAGLEAAQNAVTDAQNEVNNIDSQIRSHQSRISKLKSEINWWNNWYKSAPWWEKSWRWTRLCYEVGWRSAEITAQYAAIGVLQVSRTAAWAVLEIAKTSLKIAEAVIVLADSSLDPRVIALVAARAVAWTALTIAEGLVAAAKAIVSGFSSLTQFIVEWGLGGAFDIKSATLEADFNNVKSRIVTLSADVVFLGASTNVTFSFNFDDPLASVKNLALEILANAGIELPL